MKNVYMNRTSHPIIVDLFPMLLLLLNKSQRIVVIFQWRFCVLNHCIKSILSAMYNCIWSDFWKYYDDERKKSFHKSFYFKHLELLTFSLRLRINSLNWIDAWKVYATETWVVLVWLIDKRLQKTIFFCVY